jgi:lysyl-tRNA synthetase, class I
MRHPPPAPSQHVSYRLLVDLASVAPSGGEAEYVAKRLLDYRAVKEIDSNVNRKIELAINWAREFSLEQSSVEIGLTEADAIREIALKLESLRDADSIQTLIFDVAKSRGIKPPVLFKALYLALLGVNQGPRLGPYIVDVGPSRVAARLRNAVQSEAAALQ